jgi:twinkle protein
MDGIFHASDVVRDLKRMYEGGLNEGKRLGLPTDNLFRWRDNWLVVLTGYPNMGKSAWWDMVMHNASYLYGVKHVVYTAENTIPVHCKKLIMKHIGKKFCEPKGMVPGMTIDEAKQAIAWVNDHFFWIQHDDKTMSVDELLEYADYLRDEKGCSSLLIDPWNEVENLSSENISEYISKSLAKVRKFNRKHKFLTCIVAHPKLTNRDSKGQYPVPTSNDIHGSYSWRARADAILCFHRHDITTNRNTVYCQKMREIDFGGLGSAEVDWDHVSGRFKGVNDDYYTLPYREGEEPAYE